ncbi:MAG: SAM-dependent methyltransferase [Paludibacteraceae bacterium]|nr:SAM-dependent methyltransferase [Paludibacteraceae bacterium]
MKIEDLALQRSKYKHLTDDEWRWFLQQVEGRERTADKLPAFAAIEDWWYPVRLSCEQCSSELAAKYKASLVSGEKMADLTGGYGVDSYFFSDSFSSIDYVEQNEELCRIAAHNFANKLITIHNTSAEEFLQTAGQYDLIFLDPARRDSHGGKVFRLEDCTPNVVELLPTMLVHGKRLMLKLSPMLDLTQALKSLSTLNWDIYVVAIKNEVKELLLLSGGSGQITSIDLDKMDQAFVFTREEESNSRTLVWVLQQSGLTSNSASGLFLYEPNAAILKAGAYKLVSERFGLAKLDVNTHLYVSEDLVADFPGRVWKIESEIKNQKFARLSRSTEITNANILCRNYPLTPEQLKKKLRLRDGGTDFVIGCRVNGKPTLFLAERV